MGKIDLLASVCVYTSEVDQHLLPRRPAFIAFYCLVRVTGLNSPILIRDRTENRYLQRHCDSMLSL